MRLSRPKTVPLPGLRPPLSAAFSTKPPAVPEASQASHPQLLGPERARCALPRLWHLAARGFNIDSLVVCNTEVDDLSRMTIVLQGQEGVVEQARRQLEDLVPVWAVLDYTQSPLVQRELLLAKISILGPEYFEELLAHHRDMASNPELENFNEEDLTEEERQAFAEEAARDSLRKDYHPSNLAVSQALRHKHEHLRAITFMTHQFKGKVLDISTNNCIVELSAKSDRIDSFMKLIAPFGILESARTGE